MNHLPFLSQRLFNTALAIHPGKCEVIIGALAERLGVASLTRISGETVALAPMAFDGDGEFTRASRTVDMGYDVIAGVAAIPICGTLVQKLGSARPYSGMTGYDGIRAAFLCAVEDPDVKAIVLDIDSPGGEVAGMFALADEIYNARGEKPIHAVLNEVAYSAAYALASSADRITVPIAGGTGSIGVVAAHVDFSKALSSAGLNVTFFQYGARKTDGASEKPLSDEALTRFQADIDTLGEMFVDLVARNRDIAASKIRAMEAGTFLGAAGVRSGLADAVMAPDAAFRALLASIA